MRRREDVLQYMRGLWYALLYGAFLGVLLILPPRSVLESEARMVMGACWVIGGAIGFLSGWLVRGAKIANVFVMVEKTGADAEGAVCEWCGELVLKDEIAATHRRQFGHLMCLAPRLRREDAL